MTKDFLFDFISKHRHAVLATVTKNKIPEAALVGFAVNRDLEIIFDTVTTSRKYKNLIADPSIAFVIGWENEQTVQYEGRAEVLKGPDEKELLEIYFEKFPDGRERKETWKDLVHFRVSPVWIRFSDFNIPIIKEKKF
ncbi:MAG: pyridoxamine 5'-phosphate oxidase family protein [Bacteroidetes bacterium]|nr:pyridoxamine 5'-phosphate oxidase family protein [Bacteroidota bacterium]